MKTDQNAMSEFAKRWIQAATGQVTVEPPRVECRRQGWGRLTMGRSVYLRVPMRINGREFAHGLGTHADSEIVLRSPLPLRRFHAFVGVDDNPDQRRGKTKTRQLFTIEAGGRELWRSPEMLLDSDPLAVDLRIEGDVRELVLKLRDLRGVIACSAANWADLVVETDDGSAHKIGDPDELPFPAGAPLSFRFGGRPSAELLASWPSTRSTKSLPEGITEQAVVWNDPATGLECRMEMRSFEGSPAAEWIVRFTNRGAADTPILEDVMALDAPWNAGGPATLFRSNGSSCHINDFQYLAEPLYFGGTIRMAAGGGRSSNDWLPFFNLQGGGGGVITAIGWSGQWAAEFSRGQGDSIRMCAGMEQTHLRLHPGESIRTPRILLVFWKCDRMSGHNDLRRFILKHHTPRLNGKPLQAPITAFHWGGMKTKDHLDRIRRYAEERLKYDAYWIDAGWYGPADSYSPDEHTGDWANHVGNWNVNPTAHPGGLRPIGDAARAAGMKFLLWFEPERAVAGTPLTNEHPDWFYGEFKHGESILLNLGNPEALKWLKESFSKFIEEHGVDIYRQDFNFFPLSVWRAADAPDRQGISEIRHIEGLYEFWDELLRRHPGLMIDNCASGGRRIDLETIGRSIALWRTDWTCFFTADPIGCQVHGMGLAHWVPLSGTGVIGFCERASDTYNFRSSLGPGMAFGLFPYEHSPIGKDYPYDWHRRMLADYERARPLFYGDYYPLTPCEPSVETTAAYQMHHPGLNEGFVLAFRRVKSTSIVSLYPLKGLDADAEYTLTDADSGRTWRESGEKLSSRGLRVDMEDAAPNSRLVFYKR